MSKQKSLRGATKRFKRLGSGDYKHKQSHLRHLLTKRSPKRRRQLRPHKLVSASDFQHVVACMAYA